MSQALRCNSDEEHTIGVQLTTPHIEKQKLSGSQLKALEYRVYFEENERKIADKWRESQSIKAGEWKDFGFRNLTISLGWTVPIFGRMRHP